MIYRITAIFTALTVALWLCACGTDTLSDQKAETSSDEITSSSENTSAINSGENNTSNATETPPDDAGSGSSITNDAGNPGGTPPDGAGFSASSVPGGTSLDDAGSGASGSPGGTPPDGADFSADGGPGGTPPDGGQGGGPGGTPPGGGQGGGPGGTPPDGGQSGGPGGGQGGGPGKNSSSKAEGQLGSWSLGGTEDYAYDAALYLTADGLDQSKSSTDRISGGSYDDQAADGITLTDTASGDTGILVDNTDYTISNSTIEMLTDADGTDTCDFSGKGSAIAVFGDDANVLIDNTSIHTAGVAAMPVFGDAGAVVTIRNSTLQSDGGTLHKEYLNTPEQTTMVAPPWILGILGTSRCTNIMGDNTVMNVLDSETSAGAWAVLSTDAGSDMTLNVYNTSLTLNNADESLIAIQEDGGQVTTKDNPYTEKYGSGYGTYAIGDASETFAGAELNVGTYATIFTGGSAVYTSLEKGKSYDLTDSKGNSTGTYTAQEDKNTEIHSDTFGFMVHKSSNSITIDKGTVVDTAYDTFLVKSGADNESVTVSVDDAKITNGGVLIQVMDNDDETTGGMMDTDDEANTNGGSQNFKPVHTEDAGFDTSEVSAGSSSQDFTFTNGTYSGNIYNASGSDGLNATTLNVSLGAGAQLNGAAAMTSAIHVTCDGKKALRSEGGLAFDSKEEAAAFAEKYQNTSFTISEYYDIGQVANLISDNGGNAMNISLTDDAVWNVTSSSCISSLSIEGSACVNIPADVTLTINGQEYSDTTLTAESF